MTMEDVLVRLDEIREHAKLDDERAHIEEKQLWHDVLDSIARMDCLDPIGMARLALETRHIQFSRWYA